MKNRLFFQIQSEKGTVIITVKNFMSVKSAAACIFLSIILNSAAAMNNLQYAAAGYLSVEDLFYVYLGTVFGVYSFTFSVIPVFLFLLGWGFYFSKSVSLVTRYRFRRLLSHQRIKSVFVNSCVFSFAMTATTALFCIFIFDLHGILFVHMTELFLKVSLMFNILGCIFAYSFERINYKGKTYAFLIAFFIPALEYFLALMATGLSMLYKYLTVNHSLKGIITDMLFLILFYTLIIILSSTFKKRKEQL